LKNVHLPLPEVLWLLPGAASVKTTMVFSLHLFAPGNLHLLLLCPVALKSQVSIFITFSTLAFEYLNRREERRGRDKVRTK